MRNQIFFPSLPAICLLAGLVAGLSGCNRAPDATTVATAARPAAAAPTAKADVVAANIDASINPGDDFFAYANGAWLKNNPIPPSEASWGIGKIVREDLYTNLRKISEQAAAQKNAASGSDEQKIGDFWSTAMDEGLADRLGLRAAQGPNWRASMRSRMCRSALDAAFALQPLGLDAFFDFGVFAGRESERRDGRACRSGRPRAARPRLLLQQRGRRRQGARGLCDPSAQHVQAARRATTSAASASATRRDGVRDRAGEGFAQARGPARSAEELQQDDAGRTDEKVYAVDRLARASERMEAAAAVRHRRPAGILRRSAEACSRRRRWRCCATTCACIWSMPTRDFLGKDIDDGAFRLLRPACCPGRRSSGRAGSACWTRRTARSAWCSGRIFVKEYFPEAAKQRYNASGRGHPHRLRRAHRPARLDERRDQGQGA